MSLLSTSQIETFQGEFPEKNHSCQKHPEHLQKLEEEHVVGCRKLTLLSRLWDLEDPDLWQ